MSRDTSMGRGTSTSERARTKKRSPGLALFFSALVAGCAGAGEQEAPVTPAESPPKPWKAEALAGPFPTVADFCKTLNAAACGERNDAILVLGDARQPRATKDGGTVQLVTVVSNDGKVQRAHLLLKRDAELFALPPAHEHDPGDGKRHVVTIRSFEDASGLFVLTYGTEVSSGDGDTARQELAARQARCRVARDFPIACALFETERSVTTGPGLVPVPEQSAEVIVKGGPDGRVTLKAHAQSGDEAMKALSAPGDYRITFP